MLPRPLTVVWFRRDLRVADLPSLRSAAERGDVVCLWIADPTILQRRHHRAPARLRFLRAGLEALHCELQSLGVGLVVRRGRADQVLPAVCAEAGADLVTWTREVSPLGRARDERVRRALAAAGVATHELAGQLLAEPEDLPGSKGHGYLVFTPFSRVWMDVSPPAHQPAPQRLTGPALATDGWDVLPAGDPPIPAGPAAARAALVGFLAGGAADRYAVGRNQPGGDGTSRLSAYLRFGMCTSAQIGRALGLPGELSGGRAAFWRQVCWGEFYAHHLARHPAVARAALRPEFRDLEWDNDPAMIDAWVAGKTGYPFVDAAMRQLAGHAWVHNRARMVAASFLVKDLLIDWRIGERIFMQSLVDGDPANNNGGWQWTAGTGTDAAPYFRVLNPVLQAKKLDPQGDYVRRWVPELRAVPPHRIFEPWTMSDEEQAASGCRIGRDYPGPIVDHAERRRDAIARYRAASERGA